MFQRSNVPNTPCCMFHVACSSGPQRRPQAPSGDSRTRTPVGARAAMNEANESCGLKSAASPKLMVSTLRDEPEWLMTLRAGQRSLLLWRPVTGLPLACAAYGRRLQ